MFWRKLALGFAVAAGLATAVPAEAGFFRDLVDNMDLQSGPLGNVTNANSPPRQRGGGLGLNLNLQPGGQYYPENVNRSRVAPRQFRRQTVNYQTKEKPGTIIINPRQHFLYYVLGNGKAVRYGIGVGREGFGWSGTVSVGRKAEWPAWTPPPAMIARERAKGRILPARMEGGPQNPLGARALYLYRGGNDTLYRIHGTNEPWTIGLNVSSGCIRMVNNDVVDLYNRAKVGARVIVQ